MNSPNLTMQHVHRVTSFMPEDISTMSSHLSSVENIMTMGKHDEFKSRLVLHGKDLLLYPDRSSPKVNVHAIMMSLAVIACEEEYKLGEVDVKRAFIQM